MEVEIIKFDDLGRGIGYLNNQVVFVPKTVPGDFVKIEIVFKKKNYLEGKIIEIVKPSKMRIEYKCPYFSICGGCDLMHISLSNMLDFKINKVNNILLKNKINYEVKDIYKSECLYNYRNKISLKIVNTKVGFYESKTHNLVEVKNCLLCKEEINNFLNDLSLLGINNGLITIRCNYQNELLLIIETLDELKNIDLIVNKYKIVGIICNEKCLYGENYFIEKVDNYLFKVSYNSFFQVNNNICSKLFTLIKDNTINSHNILDFYCGVGTLGIVASSNNSHVTGVEIVENTIEDANINKFLNKITNIDFFSGDAKKMVNLITNDYDTIILDPPRSGVSKDVIFKIINSKIEKIIYISCNPITLVRDLKLLESDYIISNIELLDMFPNTEHVESICVLERK